MQDAAPFPSDDPRVRHSAPARTRGPHDVEFSSLLHQLDELRSGMAALEGRTLERHGAKTHPAFHASVRNLAHYVALRSRDLRALQGRLAQFGLSSLGRTEGHVLAAIDAVRHAVRGLLRLPFVDGEAPAPPVDVGEDSALLERNAESLLGPRRSDRSVRIMVTLSREAADDPEFAARLEAAGMDVARVNLAHDGPEEWARMAAHVRRAAAAAGRAIPVLMDLPGPKLRTGDIVPGPAVVRWRPPRDDRGRTTAPARIWLSSGSSAPAEAQAHVPVDGAWWPRLRVGDVVRFRDLRGRNRRIRIVEETEQGRWAEADRSGWLERGLRLVACPKGRSRDSFATSVGSLPASLGRIRLNRGDSLVLTKDPTPGRPAVVDAASGSILEPARIPCTLIEAFECVRVGEPVWLDDGKIGGMVREVAPDRFRMEVTQVREGGARLGADKGVNLPETDLKIGCFTKKDVEALEFVRAHADLVGLSFVGGPQDVEEAWARLRDGTDRRLGVLIKIETRRAFDSLARILMAAMEGYPVGVMIARGDLAVESGFARLAEMQEEILWMCEAAHVPVVWATQVLETLAREGMPTRAEVTDAAMSERAECVMLNKGPHLLRALSALGDILVRMEGHQHKKTALLRPLRISALD